MRRMVRQYVEDHGVSSDKSNEVVLAVDEACTNAIRHAYDGQKNQDVSLVLKANEEWIEIVVRDMGRTAPADAVARRAPEPLKRDELTPGGLGVQLIYEAFDDVSFLAAEPQGNLVVMRLRRQAKREG